MVKFLDFRLFDSLQLPKSQKCCKLKKTAQSFLKQTVNILLMEERSRSKSVEEIALQVPLDSSFAVFTAMCKEGPEAGV